MEAMKDSGNHWIGQIPLSWDTKKIKYLATLKGRIGWQGLTSDEYQDEGVFLITGVDFRNGGIDWESCEHVPMKRWEEAKDIQIKNGDLLITKDGTIGKVAIVSDMPGETSLNSGVLRIMTYEGYNRKYLYWVLQSEVFWNWFNYKNAGNSTIQHLYQGDFAEFVYAYPQSEEQQAIADFLDDKCRQIDGIIADIEKQIELLKNYKKSLITETVTKGLDKNVRMKDSGVEWIRLKYLFSVKSGDSIHMELLDEGINPVYGGGKQLGTYPYYNVDMETLLIGRVGANCGCVTLTESTAWATDNALICKENIDVKYLFYLLQITDMRSEGDSSAQPLVTGFKIGNIKTWYIVDKAEQRKVADFLDDKCEKIDSIISTKQTQLTQMQQHKKSLIYENVTGKKRVGGFGNE